MNELETEEKLAEFRKAPRSVQTTVFLTILLGAVSMLRFLASALNGYVSWPKGIVYGILVMALFWFNGFALYHKRRSAYLVINLFAAPPFLGSAIWCLKAVKGQLGPIQTREMLLGGVGIVQLLVTFWLWRLLFCKEMRDYIWGENNVGK